MHEKQAQIPHPPTNTTAPTPQTETAPRYQITELPTLGGEASNAKAINERGQVVGVATLLRHLNGVDKEVSHAALWQSNGQVKDLTSGLAGNIRSEAVTINEKGDVVINLLDTGRTMLWTHGKGSRPLSLDALTKEKYRFDYATDISDEGHVVGHQKKLIFDDAQGRSVSYAFVWRSKTARGLSSGTAYSYANGINCRGAIVGKEDVTESKPLSSFAVRTHAALWRSGDRRFIDLGTLVPDPCNSEAVAINDKEQVTGFSYMGNANAPLHAFLWQSGKMVDLGALVLQDIKAKTLPGTSSIPRGINNRGQVVGYTTGDTVGGDSFALLWQNNRAYDLYDCIAPSQGWVLSAAVGINDKGQIVGVGTHNGKSRGFILTPISQQKQVPQKNDDPAIH